jgi:hypothetical protein
MGFWMCGDTWQRGWEPEQPGVGLREKIERWWNEERNTHRKKSEEEEEGFVDRR